MANKPLSSRRADLLREVRELRDRIDAVISARALGETTPGTDEDHQVFRSELQQIEDALVAGGKKKPLASLTLVSAQRVLADWPSDAELGDDVAQTVWAYQRLVNERA